MRTIRFVVLAAAVPTLLSLAACEDPAKDKPKATVAPASSAQADTKPASTTATTETLDVDTTASTVGFIGSKVTGKHEGKFEKLAGKITLADGKAEGGKISFEVETASVKTDAGDLDKHLKNADFFDVEKFPKATFTSTEIKAGGTNGAT
ncbi:MAG TPA: YceI family protein, partial [Polyangium sp.]|nr:YceI family protein [Polyangium sp.]